MMDRKLQALDALFEDQQIMNDDSEGELKEMSKGGNWIQKAVNPAHKGYCTPMTKKTCTPRRKAFAMTMKKHHGFHEEGGKICYDCGGKMGYQDGGVYDMDENEINNLIKQGYKLEIQE